jgi:predicted RecA/RadA family phage recombinase
MARNEVFKDANYLSLPVPVGTLSGAPVRVGQLNGVAQTAEPTAYLAGTASAGAEAWLVPGNYNEAPSGNKVGFASVALVGAFNIPVATTTALAIGDPVYIVTASNTLTTTSNTGANPVFGVALSVKGTTAGQNVIVRITN